MKKMFGVLGLAAVLAVSVAEPREVNSILLEKDNNQALPQEHEAAESQIEHILQNHRERLRHEHEAKLRNEWYHASIGHHPNSRHYSLHELERLKHLAAEAFKLADKNNHKEGNGPHHGHHGVEASRIIDDHNRHNPYLVEVLHKAKEHSLHHQHKPHLEHKPHHEERPHHEHRPHHEVRHHEESHNHELDHHHDKRVHPHHDYLHIYKQPIAVYLGKAYAYLPYTERPLLHYEELPYHRHHYEHERKH